MKDFFLALVVSLAIGPQLAHGQNTKTPTTPAPTPQPTTQAPSVAPSDVPSSAPTMHLAEAETLENALTAFSDQLLELDSLPALDVAIPLLGMSVNDITGEAGVYAAVNFRDFVTDNTALLLADTIEQELNTFVNAQTGVTVANYTSPASTLCKTAQANPIVADWADDKHTEMDIKFCMEVPYSKAFTLSGHGLFDASELNILVDTSAPMTATATITMAAILTVYFDEARNTMPTLSMEPLQVSAGVQGSADMKIVFGVLETTSTASVDLSVDYNFCFGTGTCPDATQLGISHLYLSSTGEYTLNGTLALVGDFPGLTLPSDATFTITGDEILTNYVPQITSPNLPDLDSFVRFGPKNLLRMLRQIEATLYRLQENELFLTTSVPLTDTTFTDVISTGSILLANKHIVATPQALQYRPKKSRTLLSSAAFSTDLSSSAGKTYELVYATGPDLLANPDDLTAVSALANTSVCSFTLAENLNSTEDMANQIVAGINANTTCGIQACRWDSATQANCTRDSTGNSPTLDIHCTPATTCQVVMDTYVDATDKGNKLFLSSVVDTDETTDVVFLSLNEDASVRAGPTNLYGFPVNQASSPELEPRYNSMVDFVENMESKYRTVLQYYCRAIKCRFPLTLVTSNSCRQ